MYLLLLEVALRLDSMAKMLNEYVSAGLRFKYSHI